MNKKIKAALLSGCLLFSVSSWALDFENYLGLGMNIDTYKSDLPPNYDLENNFSLAPTIGFKSIVLWGNVGLRTGLFAEWKKVKLENDLAPAGETNIRLTAYYLAIPLNLQFNLHDRWAIFGGLTPRVLLTKTCNNCGRFDDDMNYLVNYSNLGITFKMNEGFSWDFSFQQALTDNFEDLKISTAQILLNYKFE